MNPSIQSSDNWAPTSFLRYIKTIGSSSRVVIIATDAGTAYLKARNNPEGPHILACDYLGTKLAQQFGLPTFEIAILELTEYDLVWLNNEKEERAELGPAFVSRHEDGITFGNQSTLHQIENLNIIPRLIVFDTWLRNCDRCGPQWGKEGVERINRDNLFLSQEEAKPGRFRLKAIDHGHIFTCGKPLSKDLNQIGNVKDRRLYGLFPEFREHVTVESLDEVCLELNDMKSDIGIDILQEIPDEWEIGNTIRNTIQQFLKDRAQFLAQNLHDIAHEALKPEELNFPQQSKDAP